MLFCNSVRRSRYHYHDFIYKSKKIQTQYDIISSTVKFIIEELSYQFISLLTLKRISLYLAFLTDAKTAFLPFKYVFINGPTDGTENQ